MFKDFIQVQDLKNCKIEFWCHQIWFRKWNNLRSLAAKRETSSRWYQTRWILLIINKKQISTMCPSCILIRWMHIIHKTNYYLIELTETRLLRIKICGFREAYQAVLSQILSSQEWAVKTLLNHKVSKANKVSNQTSICKNYSKK